MVFDARRAVSLAVGYQLHIDAIAEIFAYRDASLAACNGIGSDDTQLVEADGGQAPPVPNSIDNLAAHDPFVRAAADLPMSPTVRVHSIIARSSAEGALEDSNDGLVPYRSAHLPNAESEKVIVSGHSVQETAPAILEVRRILHQDLAEHVGRTPGPAEHTQ